MTKNQIDYLRARQEAEHNAEVRKETNRANLENEKNVRYANLTNRLNQIEQGRHNQVTEILSQSQMREQERSHRAQESINMQQLQAQRNYQSGQLANTRAANMEVHRSNLAREGLTLANQNALVAEHGRHNRATEKLTDYANYTQRLNAYTQQANASTNALNAQTNRSKFLFDRDARLLILPYQQQLLQAQTGANNAQMQYTLSRDSALPVELGYGFLNSIGGLIHNVR